MGKELGKRIKEIRLASGLSQEEFALSLGYTSRSAINKIELGNNDMTMAKLMKLSEVYHVNLEELLKPNKVITKEMVVTSISLALYQACHNLNTYTLDKIEKAKCEECGIAKEIMTQIQENAILAKKEGIPMCQDTGIVTVFVELGSELRLNFDLEEAINEGVHDAYTKYYLRKSVADPLSRINTQDNTPAIIHTKLVYGSDNLKMTIAPKGAGSENMSKLKMLNPTDGEQGIIDFVVSSVKEAGGRPCPPLFLGIGIGGNFETCALMAKHALLKETPSNDSRIKALEEKIKQEVNKLNIGPMGLGGKTTCFEVFIEACPCHIASLPVALNIQCHANRHVEVIL